MRCALSRTMTMTGIAKLGEWVQSTQIHILLLQQRPPKTRGRVFYGLGRSAEFRCHFGIPQPPKVKGPCTLDNSYISFGIIKSMFLIAHYRKEPECYKKRFYRVAQYTFRASKYTGNVAVHLVQ